MRKGNARLVPVILNGKKLAVDANSIPKEDRISHHGFTDSGKKVNSAQSYEIGESTIVWASETAPAVSFLNTDLEVLARQVLERNRHPRA